MLYSHHAIDIQQHLRLYNLKSLVEKLNKVLECAFEAKVVADNQPMCRQAIRLVIEGMRNPNFIYKLF